MEIWKLFAWYEYDSLFCPNKHITKAIVITASPQSQWPLANIIVGLHTDWRWLLEIEWPSQLFNLRQTFFAPDSGIRTSATKCPGSGHKRFSSHKYFSVANIFLWTLGWDRQLTGTQGSWGTASENWKLLRFLTDVLTPLSPVSRHQLQLAMVLF